MQKLLATHFKVASKSIKFTICQIIVEHIIMQENSYNTNVLSPLREHKYIQKQQRMAVKEIDRSRSSAIGRIGVELLTNKKELL